MITQVIKPPTIPQLIKVIKNKLTGFLKNFFHPVSLFPLGLLGSGCLFGFSGLFGLLFSPFPLFSLFPFGLLGVLGIIPSVGGISFGLLGAFSVIGLFINLY